MRSAIAVVGALLPLASCLPSIATVADTTTQKALYFLENNRAGGKLAAVGLDPATGLILPNTLLEYSTGGRGGGEINSSDHKQFLYTSLQNQAAVVVGDNYVFTVNSGSNTVAMFSIDPSSPTNLTLVGTPAPSLGQFPVSVAYSSALSQACVITGGKVAGISCFHVTPTGLTPDGQGLRHIQTGQTTPPVDFQGTPSQISFSPSSTYIMATIKGTNFSGGESQEGYVLTYPVINGVVAKSHVQTKLEDNYIDWAFTWLGNDETAFIVNGGGGGSVVDIAPSAPYNMSLITNVFTDQIIFACWIVYCPSLQTVYISDSQTSHLMVVDTSTNSLAGFIEFPPNSNGGYDIAIDGQNLYQFTGTSQVLVYNLANQTYGQQSQWSQKVNLGLKTSDRRGDWVGAAIYPASS